ncbi:cytochrome P450 [Mycena albidolilacea]|uniref:Cytochrome P450 n=1 Tax=Mycena albidolilacea TaxID=1033008 RepID=A0AAD7EBF1_9AGAR|nr:cytochrome P450 [Mycena albidolilacea]
MYFGPRSYLTDSKGPIFHINIAGQNTVVLGNHKVAADLLDRRSGIYSDRPRNTVTRILTGDMVFAFAQVTPTWRRMRKASHEQFSDHNPSALGPQIARNYHTLQEREATVLVDQMIKAPLKFNDHIKRASASLVMAIIYGTPIADSNDPIVAEIQKFVDRALGAAAPGAFLVEYFTWMEYLPRWMSGWRRYAEFWYQKDSMMLTGLFANAQARRESGDDGPSVAATLMENTEKDALSVRESAWLTATLYAAGAETSAGQMEWFMISMILYPEVQTAAQQQLDEIVGRGRMPTLADYDHLPYIRAIVREVLRWRTVLPLGLPHRLSEDDWYEGFLIPKDSVIIPNIWGMNHDPAIYGVDVEIFRPERYLSESGELKPPPKDTKQEGHCSYGFGKRICVGRHIANRSLFIEVAAILWSFNIKPVHDRAGDIVLPDSIPKQEGSLILSAVSVPPCLSI